MNGIQKAVTPAAAVVLPDNVSMQEFLERIMDERDRLYDMRFKAAETAVNTALAAQEKAVNAALAAQEKQTASSFMASEKAIVKAEDAQREYNIRSNEFRGQLDDQAKTLMPRPETTSMFKSADEKLASTKGELERMIASLRASIDKNADTSTKEIASLRESRSMGIGNSAGSQAMWGYVVGGLGTAALVASLISTVLR